MSSNITGKVQITIDVPVSKVWHALTTPEVIKQYFFGTEAVSDFKKGSPILFQGEWQGKQYMDKGTILDVAENRLFQYSYWSSMSGLEDKPENYATVTYTLEDMDGKATRLTITQDNIPTEAARAHSEANWQGVLQGLKQLLEQHA
jgi:uncharacterized protein YndB with AHSA1/START domain